MRTKAIAAAMMLVCVTAAEGHSWYPKECCHDHDCQPVPCGELQRLANGDVAWRQSWRTRLLFGGMAIKDSPDGLCHVCTRDNGLMLEPLCVFVPKVTS